MEVKAVGELLEEEVVVEAKVKELESVRLVVHVIWKKTE